MIYHLILGSNMNDPAFQVNDAVKRIGELKQVSLKRKSSLARTKAYGYEDQDDFYNQVLEIDSQLSPDALLLSLQTLEIQMGRKRDLKWGPRIIDVDILLAEDTIINFNDLVIPHYDMHNREFTLKLLCELIPDVRHPVLNKTIIELYDELRSSGGIK